MGAPKAGRPSSPLHIPVMPTSSWGGMGSGGSFRGAFAGFSCLTLVCAAATGTGQWKFPSIPSACDNTTEHGGVLCRRIPINPSQRLLKAECPSLQGWADPCCGVGTFCCSRAALGSPRAHRRLGDRQEHPRGHPWIPSAPAQTLRAAPAAPAGSCGLRGAAARGALAESAAPGSDPCWDEADFGRV